MSWSTVEFCFGLRSRFVIWGNALSVCTDFPIHDFLTIKKRKRKKKSGTSENRAAILRPKKKKPQETFALHRSPGEKRELREFESEKVKVSNRWWRGDSRLSVYHEPACDALLIFSMVSEKTQEGEDRAPESKETLNSASCCSSPPSQPPSPCVLGALGDEVKKEVLRNDGGGVKIATTKRFQGLDGAAAFAWARCSASPST